MNRSLISKNKNLLFSLSIYLFVFFGIPFLFHLINPEAMALQFQGTNDYSSLLYVCILLFVIIIFYNITSHNLPNTKLPSLVFNLKVIHVLSVVFLAVSIYFYINFSFKFRHTGEGLTSAGNDIIFLSLLKVFFKTYLFTTLIFFLKSGKITWKMVYIHTNSYLFLVFKVCIFRHSYNLCFFSFWNQKTKSTYSISSQY